MVLTQTTIHLLNLVLDENFGLENTRVETIEEFAELCTRNNSDVGDALHSYIPELDVSERLEILKKYPYPNTAMTFLFFHNFPEPLSGYIQELDDLLVKLTPVDYYSWAPDGMYVTQEESEYYVNPYLQAINVGAITFAEKLYEKGFRLDTRSSSPSFPEEFTGFDWSTYIQHAEGVWYLYEKYRIRPKPTKSFLGYFVGFTRYADDLPLYINVHEVKKTNRVYSTLIDIETCYAVQRDIREMVIRDGSYYKPKEPMEHLIDLISGRIANILKTKILSYLFHEIDLLLGHESIRTILN